MTERSSDKSDQATTGLFVEYGSGSYVKTGAEKPKYSYTTRRYIGSVAPQEQKEFDAAVMAALDNPRAVLSHVEPSVTAKEWQALVDAAREEGRCAGKNEALAERLSSIETSLISASAFRLLTEAKKYACYAEARRGEDAARRYMMETIEHRQTQPSATAPRKLPSITLNGRRIDELNRRFTGELGFGRLTYGDLVELSGKNSDIERVYTVTYSYPHDSGKQGGSLKPSERSPDNLRRYQGDDNVEIEDGMVFNVMDTSKA